MSELPRGNQGPVDQPITHHGPPGGGAGRVLLAAAIVLLLVAVAGGTTWWMYTRDPAPTSNTAVPTRSPSASTCPGVKLRVVAAPEIAPVVSAAAKTLDDDPAKSCDPIEVVAEEPGLTVANAAKPDIWIPSSSAWLGIANAGGAAFTAEGKPLAHSPIMLAAPVAVTTSIAKGDQTSWAQLTGAQPRRQLHGHLLPRWGVARHSRRLPGSDHGAQQQLQRQHRQLDGDGHLVQRADRHPGLGQHLQPKRRHHDVP